MLKVIFQQDEVLQDTVRFKEVLPDNTSESVLEQIEIPKRTMEKMKWKSPKEKIIITIKREKERPPMRDYYRAPEPPEGYETMGAYVADLKKKK